MLRARAVEAGERDAPALGDLVREAAAAFTGLRLRDGAVVLEAERRRRVEQVRVVNSDAFDPNRDGLMLVTDCGLKPPSERDRLTNFAWIIESRRRWSAAPWQTEPRRACGGCRTERCELESGHGRSLELGSNPGRGLTHMLDRPITYTASGEAVAWGCGGKAAPPAHGPVRSRQQPLS